LREGEERLSKEDGEGGGGEREREKSIEVVYVSNREGDRHSLKGLNGKRVERGRQKGELCAKARRKKRKERPNPNYVVHEKGGPIHFPAGKKRKGGGV